MLTGAIKVMINKLFKKIYYILFLSEIEKTVKTLTNTLKAFINFFIYLIDTFFYYKYLWLWFKISFSYQIIKKTNRKRPNKTKARRDLEARF